MSRIVIEKIEFQNFRQYGTGSLSFQSEGSNLLSVLIAKNGTGKTTLLNAITWCLYNTEKHLPEGKKALSILNAKVLRNSELGTSQDVFVAITISADNKTIEFKRTQTFDIVNNNQGVKETIPGIWKFTASTTLNEGAINTVVQEGAEADALVKQYFDKDICDFYFFDGEKLSEFFAAGRSDIVKKSIFNISQVSLLENTINHLNTMKRNLNRTIGKQRPDIDALLNSLDEKQRLLEQAKKEKDNASVRRSELVSQITAAEKTLHDLAPVRQLQNERSEKDAERKQLVERRDELKRKRASFIRRYLTLLNLYPRIKTTYDYIIEKEVNGELPPSIDIDQVKKILNDHVTNCPMCDNIITSHSIDFLNDIIEKNAVSSKTSNYLSGIRDSLETLINEAQNFYAFRKELDEQFQDVADRLQKCEERLSEISKLLKGYDYPEARIKNQVQAAELKRRNAQSEMSAQEQIIGGADSKIEIYTYNIKSIEDEIEKAKGKIDIHDETELQVKLLTKLSRKAELVKDAIMNGLKGEIESTTWDFFDSMIWKKNTFGDIQIDDNYVISVFSKDNTQMTGSLSATEQMALAYAFTLAIHQVSGRNCPLVIDSPLGRVSDDNRENMARVLLETSRDKQIIMLFTPDEYSASVSAMYDRIASVMILQLSEDEDYVEGIEHNG